MLCHTVNVCRLYNIFYHYQQYLSALISKSLFRFCLLKAVLSHCAKPPCQHWMLESICSWRFLRASLRPNLRPCIFFQWFPFWDFWQYDLSFCLGFSFVHRWLPHNHRASCRSYADLQNSKKRRFRCVATHFQPVYSKSCGLYLCHLIHSIHDYRICQIRSARGEI